MRKTSKQNKKRRARVIKTDAKRSPMEIDTATGETSHPQDSIYLKAVGISAQLKSEGDAVSPIYSDIYIWL